MGGLGGGCFVKGIDTVEGPQGCRSIEGTVHGTELIKAVPLESQRQTLSALLSPALLFLECGLSQNLKNGNVCLCLCHAFPTGWGHQRFYV